MDTDGNTADVTPLFAPPSTPVHMYTEPSAPVAHPHVFSAVDEAVAMDLLREIDPHLAASIDQPPPLSVAHGTSAVNTGVIPSTEGELPDVRITLRPHRPTMKKRRGHRVQNPIPREERTYRNCRRCGMRNHNRRLCCTACYLPRAAM